MTWRQADWDMMPTRQSCGLGSHVGMAVMGAPQLKEHESHMGTESHDAPPGRCGHGAQVPVTWV